MALIGYARVSTTSQDHQLQVDALQRAGCNYIVTEVGSGARERARPQLGHLLMSMTERDSLVVWRLDRLARSVKELTQISADLSARGIGLMSLTEQIDTTTPQGRLIFNFFAMLAQFERDLIAERTKAGLDAARARGRVGGRKKLLSDSDIRQARTWLDAKTMTQQQAARALGVGRATLARALRPKETT